MKKLITAILGALFPLAISAREADINAVTVRLDSLYNAVLNAPGAKGRATPSPVCLRPGRPNLTLSSGK